MRDYNPIPIDTTKVQLPRDLYSLMEELSKSNHDTWSMHRIAEGWTYGPNRDDSKKEHPCIVPYEELPEIEKDYDRNTSGETLKAIYKLGFAITKRTTGNILVVGSYSSEEQKKLREVAKHYELTLCFYNDWESASNVLERDLSKWSAIILDTKAKLQTSEEATEFFLRNVLDDLTAVFNRNRNEIPWFIMPKEYDDFTDALIKFTVGREREKKEWGKVLFDIDDSGEALFYNISEILPNSRNYRIRCVYDEVFDVLQSYFPNKTKEILFNILLPLHYPEVFYSFVATDYYNNLRRILESLFKVANIYGLIPNEVCYKEDGTINMRYSCNYLMYGQTTYDKSDKNRQGICKGPIGNMMDTILKLTNEGSHMGEDYKTEGLYFSIMAYSLQLCDILTWFGKYIKNNDCVPLEQMVNKYEGKEYVVSKDENDIYHCEECVLPQAASKFEGREVVIERVKVNNSTYTKKYYPYFAQFRIK